MDYYQSPPWSSLSDTTFSQSPELPPQTATSSSPRRPPLASPRLFRDIFSADGGGPLSQLPNSVPPINYRETLQDVRSAIQSADMAVRNAQEAFRSGRAGSGRPAFVDLTNSPPSNMTNETMFSRTIHHPQTSIGRPSLTRPNANFMNEPVFGTHSSPPLPPVVHHIDTQEMFNPIRFRRRFTETRTQPGAGAVAAEEQRQEQAAIRRQQQARREWEGVQRQNAHRQQELDRPSTSQQQQNPPAPTAQELSSPPQEARHQITPLISAAPSPSTQSSVMSELEPVDLTAVDDQTSLNAALSRARQDAVASQKTTTSTDTDGGRSALTAYKCPICMESPQSATTTICGHVFCHRCIMDTLKWSEQQRREDGIPGRRVKGVCPVCRKPLTRKDEDGPSRSLVPLEIKFTKMIPLKTKIKDESGKGKRRADTADLTDDGRSGKGKENRDSRKKQKQEALDEELFGDWLED